MQGGRKAIAHIFSTEGMDARDLRAAMRSKCASGVIGTKVGCHSPGLSCNCQELG